MVSCTNSGVWRVSTKFKATKCHEQHEGILQIPDSLSYFGLKSSYVESDLKFTCSTQTFSEAALEFPFDSFLFPGTSPMGKLG